MVRIRVRASIQSDTQCILQAESSRAAKGWLWKPCKYVDDGQILGEMWRNRGFCSLGTCGRTRAAHPGPAPLPTWVCSFTGLLRAPRDTAAEVRTSTCIASPPERAEGVLMRGSPKVSGKYFSDSGSMV